MRRKLFLVSLVLVFALTMGLPIQAMASSACRSNVNYGNVSYKVLYKVTKFSKQSTPSKNNVIAQYNNYGSKVLEVKTMLSKLGYNVGVVNKCFDYNTLRAVAKFQKDNNLPATGVVDKTTYEKIKSQYDKLGSSGDSEDNPPAPEVPDTDNGGSDTGNDPADNVSGLTAEEQQMVNLVNQERTSRGLPALKVDMTLVKTARMKSNDMIANNYFAHQSPTYGSPFDLMKSQGVSYRYAGENLAGASSVTQAHTNLMNSSGHRANILNTNYTYIGIGIVDGGPYGKMFTQHFVGK